jgi:hypothetical protein
MARSPRALTDTITNMVLQMCLICALVAMTATSVMCSLNGNDIKDNIANTLLAGVVAVVVSFVVTHKWVAPFFLCITREEAASLAMYAALESDRLVALEERRDALYEAQCKAKKVDLMTAALTSAAVRAVATTVGSHVFGDHVSR